MSELTLDDLELSVSLDGNQLAKLLPTTIDAEAEYILGVDYGNGNSKQIKGQFYVNVHYRYKKHKKGKKYKYFKVGKALPLSSLEFIGSEVLNDE